VAESVVLLHGFGGTHRAWDGVRAHLHPNATGLSRSTFPDTASRPAGAADHIRRCVDHVLAGSRAVRAVRLLDGRRIALLLALAAPERVRELVLVSTTAASRGAERAERRAADNLLADQLEAAPFEEFIDSWRTQPLFADEPAAVSELAREDQRRNRPAPSRRPCAASAPAR